MYLTFLEYQQHGGKIDTAAFCANEFKARKLIDAVTKKRVEAMREVPEAVKRCMKELIDLEYLYAQNVDAFITNASTAQTGSGTFLVASFTNDGYSETFASGGASSVSDYISKLRTASDEAEKKVIFDYLAYEYDDKHVPLLYRGVYE